MSDYITVQATKPGTPPPRVDKRTADSSIYQIDCTLLLSENELVYGEVTVHSPHLKVTEIKPKLGKYIRFRVEGGPAADLPYSDYQIYFIVQTSNGSRLSVPITVRAFSV